MKLCCYRNNSTEREWLLSEPMAPDKTVGAGVVPARLHETAVPIDGPGQAAAPTPASPNETAVPIDGPGQAAAPTPACLLIPRCPLTARGKPRPLRPPVY